MTDALAALLSDDPAWPHVREWLAAAKNPVEVLPVDRRRAEAVLVAVGVTTRSPMGAITWETGGLVVDGWVRLLGSGCDRLQGDLAAWNGLGPAPLRASLRGAFLVAHDAAGGVFAIDGGAFGTSGHQVFYFAPDSLRWESLERGYSDFVRFLLLGDLDGFYASLRWREWRRDVAGLTLDEAFSAYPPPWTREGRDVEAVSRRPVPVTELVALNLDTAAPLAPR